MVHLSAVLAVGLIGLTSFVSSHSGQEHMSKEGKSTAVGESSIVLARSLAQCNSKLQSRSLETKNLARRQAIIQSLRHRHGLAVDARFHRVRSLDAVVNTSHNLTHIDPSADTNALFASQGSCVLGDDVPWGPYYVSGEMIRKNLVETQQGVPLYLDIQVVDTNTCKPVPSIYVDIWHANATGVYSGVIADANGNPNDTANLNKTFLRGIQRTNADGIVQFETIFPGHYDGHATHIHVITHAINETKVEPNNTLRDIYTVHSSHIGQFFFDQSLITEVEKTWPYTTNQQYLTLNKDDFVLVDEAKLIDPMPDYVYLGEDVMDGLFAWITLGINATEDLTVIPAAWRTEQGGADNPSFTGIGSPPDFTTTPTSSIPI